MRTEQSLIWISNKLKDKINQSSSHWKVNSYLGTSNLKRFCYFFQAQSFPEGVGKDVSCHKDITENELDLLSLPAEPPKESIRCDHW